MEIMDLNKDEELEEVRKTNSSGKKANNKQDEEDEKPTSIARELLSWVLYFVVAIVIALVLKTFVIINATVPTGSMENTIMPGDDILGFRLAYTFSEPKRGDIIIFKYPDDESQKYVKRIIGLPGDTVIIEDGKVYINGSTVPYQESYLKEQWVVATGPYEFQVPEDSYLVLGDNRNNSSDARYWINQYVSKDEIIGKALCVYFPFSRWGALD